MIKEMEDFTKANNWEMLVWHLTVLICDPTTAKLFIHLF